VKTPNEPNEQKDGTRYKPETDVTAKRSAIPSYMYISKHNPDLRVQTQAGQPRFNP